MARRMDPGLGTSERMAAYRSQSVMIPPQRQVDDEFAGAVATITCRSCRVRIPVDEIDAHECSPVAMKAANLSLTNRKSLDSAGSFLDSFLDAGASTTPAFGTGAVQTRQPEVPVAETLSAPSTWTPPTSADKPPTAMPVDPAFYRPPPLASIGRSLSMPSDAPAVGVSIRPLPSGPESGSVSTTASASNLLAAFSPRARSLSNPEGASVAPIQCRVRGVRVNKHRVAVYSIISSLPKKESGPSMLSSVLLPFGVDTNASATSLVSPRGSQSTTTAPSRTAGTNPANGSVNTANNNGGNEIVVERRYREFYAFALNMYAMFPSRELWQRMPPKTYCTLFAPGRRLNDGFLIRRKNGLDDFVRCAIELMDLGSSAQGSLAQWYLVRLFLNISPAALPRPTKDRSLSAAMLELKQQVRAVDGWRPVGRIEDHDAVFEKVADGFQVVKRVRLCRFPARAVFDMIVQRADGNSSPSKASTRTSGGGFDDEVSDLVPNNTEASGVAEAAPRSWDPSVESHEVLRREDGNTWVERTVYKGRWMSGSLQMVSLKTWKIEESGAIVIAMIPADDRDWSDLRSPVNSELQRVDCILGGWVLTPTPNEETCTVTWLMQANFGACDPRAEFTGMHGLRSVVARRVLLSWADEVSSLLAALEDSYDPEHYRRLGPLLSSSAFQKLRIDQPEATVNALQDPRVYAIACELEPCLCLLVHKSSNRNVLVFKANLSASSKCDVDAHTPLKPEWIMFEKPGNPRQELSTVERNTTYKFSTRLMAPNVHRLTLELLRRDCVLRYDPMRGYALFTTINGRPNTLLKHVFLTYAKAPRIGFARLEEATLVGETETEVVAMTTTK